MIKKINKETFAYILDMLEDKYIIESYQYCLDNSILVYSVDDSYNGKFHFDDKNMLIDPKIYKLKDEIKETEKKLEELKKELNNFERGM